MRRLLRTIWRVLSSRALPPLVMGLFLLVYVGIAFFTDEALIALIAFVGSSVILAALFALLPLNSASRICLETLEYRRRRRILRGGGDDAPAELFEEAVDLPGNASFAALDDRLRAVGYRTRRGEVTLSAWRGVSGYPVRMLFLAGTFCLFAGVLISLTARRSDRVTIIEGEPLAASAGGGLVSRIFLGAPTGSILAKELRMEVLAPGGENRVFGLYPPALYGGAYVYPRYLGIGLFVRFSAPDLPGGFEKHCVLNLVPPGKEDGLEIPGSPYRIVFSLVKPDDGSDPYRTGRMSFLFKVLKGKDLVFSGSAPAGGEFAGSGYRLGVPDARRLVITDFIRDNGVLFIWTSALLFALAILLWLPVRLLFPRREMQFSQGAGVIHALSRAEGKGRKHGEVFTEALDLLEARRPAREPAPDGNPLK